MRLGSGPRLCLDSRSHFRIIVCGGFIQCAVRPANPFGVSPSCRGNCPVSALIGTWAVSRSSSLDGPGSCRSQPDPCASRSTLRTRGGLIADAGIRKHFDPLRPRIWRQFMHPSGISQRKPTVLGVDYSRDVPLFMRLGGPWCMPFVQNAVLILRDYIPIR